jgi:hypothetical protein
VESLSELILRPTHNTTSSTLKSHHHPQKRHHDYTNDRFHSVATVQLDPLDNDQRVAWPHTVLLYRGQTIGRGRGYRGSRIGGGCARDASTFWAWLVENVVYLSC